jgi:hypothetical protein
LIVSPGGAAAIASRSEMSPFVDQRIDHDRQQAAVFQRFERRPANAEQARGRAILPAAPFRPHDRAQFREPIPAFQREPPPPRERSPDPWRFGIGASTATRRVFFGHKHPQSQRAPWP